jgi:pyrimidine-nucleoside phosphorylase
MTPYEIIQRKQRGESNTAEEIRFMVAGALDGRVMQAQLSAWFMAIYFQGMNEDETWELTDAMRSSGETFAWPELPGPVLDKHSTGGVGDKATFVLAPLWAACGALVPSITGRGLGHTGGTLDKLDSLPGFRSLLDRDQMLGALRAAGHSLVGQSERLVPADRLFYALRDVTATVESTPLICASILSKKLAEGLDALVLDVKCGSGAIFRDRARAGDLARRLVGSAERGGCPTAALLTDMDAPLGRQVGNWNELVEADECLQGYGPPDLLELSLALGVAGLLLAGLESDPGAALRRLKDALAAGTARERFHAMLRAQGGDPGWLLAPHRAPRPLHGRTLTATGAGFVQAIDSRELGLTGIALGAGRARLEDGIDPTAGITIHRQRGEAVRAGDPLCDIYSSTVADLDPLLQRLRPAWTLGPEPPAAPAPVAPRAGGQAPWNSRVLETIGLPFSAGDWQRLVAAEGLGLRPHPLGG